MKDDRLDEFLEELVTEYHAPPETPREAMWERIESHRRFRRGAPARRRPLWTIGLAAAAVLTIGIGIGRMSLADAPSETTELASAELEADSVIFSFVAMDHLRQMDLFLAAFRLEARAGSADSGVAAWARELLGTTRLMLDSPAALDVELVHLLEDLELVLVEISGYADRVNDWELDLIEEGLNQNAVQMRVKTRLTSNDAFAAMGVSE